MNPELIKAFQKILESMQNGKDIGAGFSLSQLAGQKTKTRIMNEATIHRALYDDNEEVNLLRESLKRRHNIDIFDREKFPVLERNFSWVKLKRKLNEADSASSFVQFLRAGIQSITNNMYESVQTTYEDWVTVVSSTMDTELYAPNHGVSFPREVGRQMKYPKVRAAALDLKLKNRKFGSLYEVEHELLEDDQTGSFQRQSGLLGEYMKLLCEVLSYAKLGSFANSRYIDYEIPISETKPSDESSYPWSTSFQGGGRNRPDAFSAIGQVAIQNAIIGLQNQKNLHGIKMSVTPDRLLVGPEKSFDTSLLLNSAYYPSGAAATGDVGGAFAINPIKGIADLTVSRFMFKNDGTVIGDSKAWYMVDSNKPWFILQLREAISIIQENPDSGQSFDRDIYRFKSRSRKNADHVDPRFAWQGNDGSV